MGEIVTFDRAALLLKEESVYNIDPTPTGVANSILIQNGRIRFQANKLVRENDQTYLGAKPFLLTGRSATVEFDVEMIGNATVDAAAPIAPVLLSLATAEVITPTTGPVVYNPISTAMKSTSGYFFIPSANASGGARHVITGLRGNGVITQSINGFSVMRVTLQGDEAVITDVAIPTQTLSAFRAPVGITTATWSLTVNGFAVDGVELQLDMGQQPQLYETSETKQVVVNGRDATGFLRIHDPKQSDLDPYALARAEGTIAIVSVVNGGTAKKLTINIPTAQLELPERIDINKASGLRIPFTALPSASGNDEYNLTFGS